MYSLLGVYLKQLESQHVCGDICVLLCVLFRNYSVVNVEKGQVEVKRMSCPGSKISCQMKMGNTLWMATEVHTTGITFTIFMQINIFSI